MDHLPLVDRTTLDVEHPPHWVRSKIGSGSFLIPDAGARFLYGKRADAF
jgi:hypothetical protein